jgi:DNA-binding NarL/FixJ family response regulator
VVAKGEYYISASISGLLIKRFAKRDEAFRLLPGLSTLTQSEMRILKLIAGSRTSKEIANELCLSPKTVENHRGNIADKLGLEGRNTLLHFAIEHKKLLLG